MTFEVQTFLISIPRSAVHRKDNIETLTQTYSPIILGIDGNDHTYETIKCKSWNRTMKRGEMGCVQSHRQVWKQIIDENIPYALVLEDDSVVNKEVVSDLCSFFTQQENYDYLNLMVHPYQHDTIVQNVKTYTPDNRFGIITPEERFPNRHIWGTNAYLIKLKFAIEMYNSTIDDPVDHMISRKLCHKSKGLIYLGKDAVSLYDTKTTIQDTELQKEKPKHQTPVVIGTETKKIAFCFLIKDKINQLELWEKFFSEGHDYNIYIHAKNPDKVKQKFTKQYLIEEHAETDWGDIYDALNLMYRKVLEHGDVKAIFVTESHIPVKSFDYVYKYVTAHDRSHIKWLSQTARTPGEKGTLIMQYERYVNNARRVHGFLEEIEIKHWYYNETYTILNRNHCKMFVEDDKYIRIFKGCGMWDENYPMFMFSKYNLWDELENEQTTHVNWAELSLDKNGMRSPKYYKVISPEDVKHWLGESVLFARKVAPECDVMKHVDLMWYGKSKKIKPVVMVFSNEYETIEDCVSVYGVPELETNYKFEGKILLVKADNTFEDQCRKYLLAFHALHDANIDFTNLIIMTKEVEQKQNFATLMKQLTFLNDDYVGSYKTNEIDSKSHIPKVSVSSPWRSKGYTGRVIPFLDLQKGWISLHKKSVSHVVSMYAISKFQKILSKELYFDLLLARALFIQDILPKELKC